MAKRARVVGVLVCAAALSGCAAPGASVDSADGARETEKASDGQTPEAPVTRAGDEVMLSCGGSLPYFTPSAMERGVDGVADESEVEAALERLAAEAGIDAPLELQRAGVADAEWIVLGSGNDEGTEELILGMGHWDADGPSDRNSQYVVLDRGDSGWQASGWGTCNLEPVLAPGTSWVEIAPTPEGLNRATTSLQIEVSERECTSSRDPEPYLNEPVVVEDHDTVTVYWTSESPTGAQTCPGNPSVSREVRLDQPLGDRVLLDGSTWPPKRVSGP